MSIAGQVVGIAEAEKGYLEKTYANWEKYGTNCLFTKTRFAGADNVQKYSYETGHYNKYGWAPWCQSFVNWCIMSAVGAAKADKLLCGMYGSASTMDVKNAMLKAGREVPLSGAQKGDLVFRSRSGGGHVGIVKDVVGGKIVSIEGNSSSSDITSWNGGAVVEHTGAPWDWCCRPDWTIVEPGWRWLKVDGIWYYQNARGENKHGWESIKETNGSISHWYYFNEKGQMQTGVLKLGDKIYYLMDEGPLEGACCLTDGSGNHYVWDL